MIWRIVHTSEKIPVTRAPAWTQVTEPSCLVYYHNKFGFTNRWKKESNCKTTFKTLSQHPMKHK